MTENIMWLLYTIIIIFTLLAIVFLLIYIPDNIHAAVYKIRKTNQKDVDYYQNLSAQEIIDKLSDKTHYTRVRAIDFFLHHKIKNSAAFIFLQPNLEFLTYTNPFGFIIKNEIKIGSFIYLSDLNRFLSRLLLEPAFVFQDNVERKIEEQMFYNYWRPIIEKHTAYTVKLIFLWRD